MELISVQVKTDLNSELLLEFFFLLECTQWSKRGDTKTRFTNISYLMKGIEYYGEVSHSQLSKVSSFHLDLSKTEYPKFFTWRRCAHSGCGMLPCSCCVPIIPGVFNIFTRTSVDIVGKVKHLGLSKTLYLAPRCSLKAFCSQLYTFTPELLFFLTSCSLQQ